MTEVSRRGQKDQRIILMNGLELRCINDRLRRVASEGDEAFVDTYGARLGEQIARVREVVEQTLGLVAASPRDEQFGGYLAVDTSTRQVVGTCGFKTGPTPDGEVEIAYFTFPAYEGRGWATAMAGELVRIARGEASVRCITAHTLPQENASTCILRKLGFQHAGSVEDPEDGTVWRWVYRAPSES